LAARMTRQMYLIVTTTITAENTSDRRRKTASFPQGPEPRAREGLSTQPSEHVGANMIRVRTRLAAGGKRIRTCGPTCERDQPFRGCHLGFLSCHRLGFVCDVAHATEDMVKQAVKVATKSLLLSLRLSLGRGRWGQPR
jgi:hypothetical protein